MSGYWIAAVLAVAGAVFMFRAGLGEAKRGDPFMFLILCWYGPALSLLLAYSSVMYASGRWW